MLPREGGVRSAESAFGAESCAESFAESAFGSESFAESAFGAEGCAGNGGAPKHEPLAPERVRYQGLLYWRE